MELIGRPTNVFPLNCGLRRIGGRPIEIVIAFYMIDHSQKWRISLCVVPCMAPRQRPIFAYFAPWNRPFTKGGAPCVTASDGF